MKKLIFCLCTLLLASCNMTNDLTIDNKNDICSVHKIKMLKKRLYNDPFFSNKTPKYEQAIKTQFPNYDGIRFNQIKDMHKRLKAQHIIDYVCPHCTEKHHDWLKKNMKE